MTNETQFRRMNDKTSVKMCLFHSNMRKSGLILLCRFTYKNELVQKKLSEIAVFLPTAFLPVVISPVDGSWMKYILYHYKFNLYFLYHIFLTPLRMF